MKAKEFLKGYYYEKKLYEQKIIENKKLKTQLDDLIITNKALIIDENIKGIIYELHKKIYALLLEEEEKLLNCFMSKLEIEKIIDTMEQPYKSILYFKYICLFDFNKISDITELSESYVYTLHKEALDILDEKT